MYQHKESRDRHPAHESNLTATPPARRLTAHRPTHSRHNVTPPEFWDNLSYIPLCLRALEEFDRRSIRLWPAFQKPPERLTLQGDLLKELKRFSRQGGPTLRDIRGVSLFQPDRTIHGNLF